MSDLIRRPDVVVVRGADVLRILVPPDVLLTLTGEDARVAERLLIRATAGPIPAPAEDGDEGSMAAALEEEDVLIEAPEQPEDATGGDGAAPIRLVYGVAGAIDSLCAPSYLAALRDAGGFELRVVMTQAATRMVRPEGLGWYTGMPVATDLFGGETADHAVLGEWADVVAVVPATAEFVCRLAAGGYSDLLAATIACAAGRVVLAPAMNGRMWERRAVRGALDALAAEGFEIVLPGLGVEVSQPEAGPGFGGLGVAPDQLPALIRLLARH